jgi:putative lipoic acid-binding regulatory protein
LISISKISRKDNNHANLLSKLVSKNLVEFPPQVWIEVLEKTSVEEKSSMVIVIQEHIREDQRTTIRQEKNH